MVTSAIQLSSVIQDVYTVPIHIFEDDRGRFMETFRCEWFPDVNWSQIQGNRSDSNSGVLRGLHYHLQQVDYWYVMNGRIRAALVDLRPSSSTYGATQTIEMGGEDNIGLFIPTGVAHGFVSLTDCTLTYVVNRYYDDGKDEFGVAWDDPDLGLDWEIDFKPEISPRDATNRRLKDIPVTELPS